MPYDTATRGTLIVLLRSASNLRSADRGGSSDPYVKLKVNATEHKSKVIDKSGCFENCAALRTISVPPTATIRRGAFNKCSALKGVEALMERYVD